MKGIVIGAKKSGAGKTLFTLGLIRAFRDLASEEERGKRVFSYKCGPDYIDPLFHSNILGVPCENLDTFFSEIEHIESLLALSDSYEISVVEGVMGLYQGIGGGIKASTYDVARVCNLPIILILDGSISKEEVKKNLEELLLGDTEGLIKGVLFNPTSPLEYKELKGIVKRLGLIPLGFMRQNPAFEIKSRHLGLILPKEVRDLEEKVKMVSEEIRENVDIKSILDLAKEQKSIEPREAAEDSEEAPIIYVAKDEAFCFIYEENIRELKDAGGLVRFFSPLKDFKLPEDANGLYIPGGYPELWLKKLCKNKSMRDSIKEAYARGIPVIAECGGFMYLQESIEDESGLAYEMVGALKGSCFNTGKLCRFGYVEVKLNSFTIKGHEFHYYDSTHCGNELIAVKASNGEEWDFGYCGKKQDFSRYLGFPHLYFHSCKEFVRGFVGACKEFARKGD